MIYIGADHRGYELKKRLSLGFRIGDSEFEDMGAHEYDKDDDYPDFATAVAKAVILRQVQDQNTRGILVCGSGIGIAIATRSRESAPVQL